MKRKIAILISLLFLATGGLLGDGLDARDALDFDAEKEDSSADDLDDFLGVNPSGALRTRQIRRKFSMGSARGLRARLGLFLPAGRTDAPSLFVHLPQQELHKLQQVYRF